MDALARLFLPAALVAWVLPAQAAFNCMPTDSAECRLALSNITVVFDSGVNNYSADGYLNGIDGYVNAPMGFPDLTAVDDAGGTRAGFSYQPGFFGNVGGSGFNGDHEALAFFAWSYLRFEARKGWRVSAVEFTVEGTRGSVGNGYVALNVPGAAVFSGESFVAGGLLSPDTITYQASFSANASYAEGEDGTADSYGTAYASFDRVSLVAHVQAVPEPATVLLWLGGWAAVMVRARPRASRPDGR